LHFAFRVLHCISGPCYKSYLPACQFFMPSVQ
jgi:hypothetical protein